MKIGFFQNNPVVSLSTLFQPSAIVKLLQLTLGQTLPAEKFKKH